MVKFKVSLISLSPVHLFVCFPNNLNYIVLLPTNARSGIKMCAVINPLIPESDQHLIFPFNITPESKIKVMRIKEMIIN